MLRNQIYMCKRNSFKHTRLEIIRLANLDYEFKYTYLMEIEKVNNLLTFIMLLDRAEKLKNKDMTVILIKSWV